MGLYVFSLIISLMMITRIFVFHHIVVMIQKYDSLAILGWDMKQGYAWYILLYFCIQRSNRTGACRISFT